VVQVSCGDLDRMAYKTHYSDTSPLIGEEDQPFPEGPRAPERAASALRLAIGGSDCMPSPTCRTPAASLATTHHCAAPQGCHSTPCGGRDVGARSAGAAAEAAGEMRCHSASVRRLPFATGAIRSFPVLLGRGRAWGHVVSAASCRRKCRARRAGQRAAAAWCARRLVRPSPPRPTQMERLPPLRFAHRQHPPADVGHRERDERGHCGRRPLRKTPRWCSNSS
jgi:hypothetical protein